MNRQANVLTDIVVYSMLVAGLFVMTAPTSKGPALVTSATNGYSGIVKAAEGR